MASRPLQVTVSVSTDDIRDVLNWADGGNLEGGDTTNRRYLYAYASAVLADARARLWDYMPASLQYCVHEVEQGRAEQLREVLRNAEGDQ